MPSKAFILFQSASPGGSLTVTNFTMRMKAVSAVMCILILGPAVMLAQEPAVNLAGVWQATARTPEGDSTMTIRIEQSQYQLSGYFVFSGDPTPVPFIGFISFLGSASTATSFGASMSLTLHGQRLGYGGDISSSRNTITGAYTANGRRQGNWVATRMAGVGPPIITAVTNAASGTSGAVAPGELISIWANAGVNPIGPTSPASLQFDQRGMVATALGGVRVQFLPTGAYAPLIYVSAGQINAVVPYEIAGLSTVQVQVQFGGQVSNAFSTAAAPAAPGIFTNDGSGRGQGSILNRDGSTANSAAAPERRGGVVVVYMTGAGQTNPAGESGKITTLSSTAPLTPRPLLPIQVLVNGQPAQVHFSGDAPGLISGVTQLNVEIPTTVSPGNVPIHVVVGGRRSQEGVTVAVQ